jgi:hypothetical protein
MARAEFETYRSAFGALLGCAASKAEKGACIDGWMKDAGTLLGKDDPKFVRSVLDYYMTRTCAATRRRRKRLCGARE